MSSKSISLFSFASVLLLTSIAHAASVEFTYFFPDRYSGAPLKLLWGDLPLQTMPTGAQEQQAPDKAYGLVYWPGETLQVHIVDASGVDRVTCTNEISGESLLTIPSGSSWAIALPDPTILTGSPFGAEAFNDDHKPSMSFDRNVQTAFIAKDATGYVGIDLGTPSRIGAIRLTPTTTCPDYDKTLLCKPPLKGGRFQATNGDPVQGPYTDLATLDSNPSEAVATVINIKDTTPYRYVRFVGPDGSHSTIADLQLLSSPIEYPSKPLLDVYRVRAYSGSTEVASRGFILTSPWSGIGHQIQPEGGFGTLIEWNIGGNPFYKMTYSDGLRQDSLKDVPFPMNERPWDMMDGVGGLTDIYFWPRLDYKYHEPPFKSDDYLDPSLDWNLWWTYYGRGLSKWTGEWDFGAFSPLAAENLVNDAYQAIIYGDLRRYAGVFPNGLLHWQQYYRGLELGLWDSKVNVWNGCCSHRPWIAASDGWGDNAMYGIGGLGAVSRLAQEVGLIPLYYQRAIAKGADTSWATSYPTSADFFNAQWNDYNTAGNPNDYFAAFMQSEINLQNTMVWETASYKAVEKSDGVAPAKYKANHYSATDWNYANGIKRDFRAINKQLQPKYFPQVLTGGDYTHFGCYIGSDAFNHSRGYRAYGIAGAVGCALFPESGYGGGYQHAAGGGGFFPGTDGYDAAQLGAGYPKEDFSKYKEYINDGTSFRRFDMFERVPSFYRSGGVMVGSEYPVTFGQSGGYESSKNPLWTTQALLGMQLLELADRTRPIGGVLVINDNNKTDRDANREFLTDQSYADYLAAMTDMLGITTYANPDTEKDIPADIPRIYVPRKLGTDQAFLYASVDGKEIKVPYTGPDMMQSTNFALQKFVKEVRDAYPSGWPISTTSGFVATAWESSNGIFIYVENPMENGSIHVPRKGQITVSIRGLSDQLPPVVDLTGDDPDPHRLADSDLSIKNGRLSISLDWQHGDARLFWVSVKLPKAPDGSPSDGSSSSGCSCSQTGVGQPAFWTIAPWLVVGARVLRRKKARTTLAALLCGLLAISCSSKEDDAASPADLADAASQQTNEPTVYGTSRGKCNWKLPGDKKESIPAMADISAAISVACGDQTALSSAIAKGGKVALRCSFGETMSITSPLRTGAALTFDGGGAVLDGGNQVRVFEFEGTSSVTLQNLAIRSGKAAATGDSSCQGKGGAICRKSGSAALFLWNVLIQNNSAESSGGGVFVDGGSLFANLSTFFENSAPTGGAISLNESWAYIINSTFEFNHATGKDAGGGAIFIHAAAKTGEWTELCDSIVVNNDAVGRGGAIDYAGIGLHPHWASISQNHADVGGGVYLDNSLLQSEASTFDNNEASSNGGAVLSAGSAEIVAYASTFYKNRAQKQGGAIFAEGGKTTVGACTLYQNDAAEGGGIVASGDSDISNSILSNSATNHVNCSKALSGRKNLEFSGDITCVADSIIADPKLGPPDQRPLSFMPLSDSPALNQGYLCADWFDERGVYRSRKDRPGKDPNQETSVCDIGAVEYVP